MKYRKKPVVIEAEEFSVKGNAPLPFSGRGDPCCLGPNGWYIATLEGDHKLTPGDMVIRGVKGEFYPCKPDIFAATYEAVPYLRAEIERLEKFEAETIDETARFNRGWERRAEPYRLLDDEFEQMGWAWAHAGEMAEVEERAATEISFYATTLKRVARALSDEVGGDDERLHDRKDCPSDDTCQCVAVRLCDESVAEEVGPGCDEED